jgi:signal transduction histidine kinase
LETIQLADVLRDELSHRDLENKMLSQAESLFFYREIALGLFHQLANNVNRVDSKLHAVDALLHPPARAENSMELNKQLSEAASAVKAAKDLIKEAQLRGQTLKPIARPCFLVADVLRPVVDRMQQRCAENSIVLEHSFTSQDYPVILDPSLGKESFINLFENAIIAIKMFKNTAKRSIFVAVRADPVGKVRVEISDSGVGMDRDLLQRVAECTPFFTTRKDGTGLGLYFTKKLFEHFEGEFSFARSQPGKGTTVAVVIPLEGANAK